MVYRICYRRSDEMNEAVVEANSPAEAVVKFRLVYGAVHDVARMEESVFSVSAEPCPVPAG